MRIIRYEEYDGRRYFLRGKPVFLNMKDQGFILYEVEYGDNEKPRKVVEDYINFIKEHVNDDIETVVYRVRRRLFEDTIEIYVKFSPIQKKEGNHASQ